MQKIIGHFINGNLVKKLNFSLSVPVLNPALGSIIADLHFANPSLITEAIDGAKRAFAAWSIVPPVKRARVLFKAKQLIEQHLDDLAQIITEEHGKTLEDAKNEIQRGIEIIEFACGIPNLLKGGFSENAATHVDSYTLRQALGVCVGFTPFNFPAMVPMWMFPIAIACGNTFILKPSEKVPSLSVKLAELFHQAGLPAGVLQVVHGAKEVVDQLLESPDVKAVSFVGSTPVAQYVYAKSAHFGKRVQALGGAKNHCIVMPDADIDYVVNSIKGAAFGAAGQRCMSISVVVTVGDYTADHLVDKLHESLEAIKIGNGTKDKIEMGPIQNEAHRARIISMIESGVASGAKLIIDGREHVEARKSKGFFLGPSLFDYVTADMEIYQQEIFGPVLCVVRTDSLEQAINLINNNPYGNGTAIFTQSGAVARKFSSDVQAGMVGINVPIPVPMAFYSFGGWKQSLFGDSNVYGPESINFYTKLKTVTTRWPNVQENTPDFGMPIVT